MANEEWARLHGQTVFDSTGQKVGDVQWNIVRRMSAVVEPRHHEAENDNPNDHAEDDTESQRAPVTRREERTVRCRSHVGPRDQPGHLTDVSAPQYGEVTASLATLSSRFTALRSRRVVRSGNGRVGRRRLRMEGRLRCPR